MKKHILSLIMVVATVIFISCSKSGDPTPKQMSSLDSVKASMTGTWLFKLATVTEISNNKTGTMVDCSKSGLFSAGFTNTNWESLAGVISFIYSGSVNAVTVNYPCSNNGSGFNDQSTFNISQLTADTFQFYSTSTSGAKTTLTFVIDKKDITPTSIKANLISNGTAPNNGYVSATLGYSVIYTFTRQ